MACLLRSMPMFSNSSSVSRSPAVSISRKRIPSITTVSSMVSRVVPCMSLTIARCSPNSAFSSVDLPTFGAPMMATGIPFRIALPVRNEAISEASFLSISAAKSFSSVRSANSNSSWSAKSSSNSISDVKCSNRSRSIDSSVDTDPRNWLIARSFSALLCDAIKSATASACARSILPFIKARRVNSPGSAALHPASISHRTSSCWI